MQVNLVTDLEQFHALRDTWNGLLYRQTPVLLPLTHEWLCAWWQVFGGNRQLHVMCAYEGDTLIAAAPFMVEHTRYRGIPVTVQKLMANGHTPFCNLIINPELSAEQTNEVFRRMTQVDTADMLLLGKVPDDSPIARFVADASSAGKLCHGIDRSLVTPVIRINGSWDEFIKARSRKFRKSLNNKLNKFNKEKGFTLRREKIESREHPCLQEMVDISTRSWKRQIRNDLGSNVAGREFLLWLADTLGPAGHVHLWIMHRDGVPVAFEYHLDFDGIVYPVRADYNEDYKVYSPGSILEYTALKSLFDEGKIQQYYSCADDYWYLNNWTDELKKHLNIEIFASSLKGRVLYNLEYRLIAGLRAVRNRLKNKQSKN